MKTFDVICTITRLPKKAVSDARKKAEVAAVLQVIAEKQHMPAQEFEAICKDNNITAKTVLQYVKHDIDYVVSRIYNFIPWDEVDDSAEMSFTGYGNSGVQVFQEMDGFYICEVVKVYYFPCCYEVSFDYNGISGSVIMEDIPTVKLPMYRRALKKAVSPELFYDFALDELRTRYTIDCYELNEKLDFEEFYDSFNIENRMQELYEDFMENVVLEVKELPVTTEEINCWYNTLDCIGYKQDPEFDLD